ncbi:neutrophil antibiotic peptide NP-1-like [Sciurus carolinensis]|uniref:neutrophil antibiotic peptide NP-1-like n=1 Tax=Sciurus carolinensis TaxID=30640 RepID=UPI001FB35C7C|nr:neutrophil antibiotic peptide NP-1-like [Sciurus carolinensis]XP_047403843.1 neutrophil antibiotic peptide NP-1-like [Sciurus carolinensis]
MRTLALLAALLLLALQAQAEPLPGHAEEAPDQEQSGEEDQTPTISFTGLGNSAEDTGLRAGVVCRCRRPNCGFLERTAGACRLNGVYYRLCCR